MKVWCYVLDATGVTGLTSFDGSEVGTPLNKHLYECEDDNIDLAQDGTGKLYHAANDKINDTDLQNALNVYYGAPIPTHTVQIRYYTTTNDIESAGIGAEGGTAELIKIEDGVYDLVSNDPLTFVALYHDVGGYGYYYYNYYLNVTRIDVISGYTLNKFMVDLPIGQIGTFTSFEDMTEFNWLDTEICRPIDMTYMFALNYGLLSLDLSMIDTSNVTNMSGTFTWCEYLKSLDISTWDTSSVITMSAMFSYCGLTSLDVTNFDTSNVVDMSDMFSGLQDVTNLDLSSFDTSGVTVFDIMFNASPLLECITNINTTAVGATMSDMFVGCTSLTSPDGTVQKTITDPGGFNYVNPNPCPAVV